MDLTPAQENLRDTFTEIFASTADELEALIETPDEDFHEKAQELHTLENTEYFARRHASRLDGDEESVAYLDATAAAKARGIRPSIGLVAGMAHMVAAMGHGERWFYQAVAPAVPARNGRAFVRKAARRLRREHLWPWMPGGSRATEIARDVRDPQITN